MYNDSQSMLMTSRDWTLVQDTFKVCVPFNYVVMDNFLHADSCTVLREKLLNHWGWRYKNWISKHLHNERPNIPEIYSIAEALKVNCSELFHKYDLIEHWALMYHKNTPGKVHADNAALTLTLWLTPDEYNLEKDTGGLVLFDVKRDPMMMPHEHLSYTNSEEYLQRHTKGRKVVIKYKYNRAVLFDAWTFHKSDTLNFLCQGADSYRINLSLAFEDPAIHKQRMNYYFSSTETSN